MQENTFSISEVLGQGWELFKKHWMLSLILLGAAIVTSMVSSLLSVYDAARMEQIMRLSANNSAMSFNELSDVLESSLASNTVSLILASFINVGIIRMVLFIVKGERSELSFDAFNASLSTYLKYVVVQLLVYVIICVGCLLCIIPGVILAVRLQYAGYCILDDPDKGVIESVKMSWNMTRGNFFGLLGFIIVGIGICLLGLVCCCVGVYASAAWLMLSNSLIYFTLKPSLLNE